MEFLTNPWFIVFTIIIAVLTFLIIKFYPKNKDDEPLLFDRLRDAEINITIKKPINPSGLDQNLKT